MGLAGGFTVRLYGGQEYRLAEVGGYPRRDGTGRAVLSWRRACPESGGELVYETGQSWEVDPLVRG